MYEILKTNVINLYCKSESIILFIEKIQVY